MQLYCKELDLYADLGTGTNFSFSLQNPWQHFYEEPEDFAYSTVVPITENNLKIFGSKYDIDIVIDNYIVMKRFKAQIISKTLATMEVSLYKQRIKESFKAQYETNFDYVSLVKSHGRMECYMYATYEDYIANDRKKNVIIEALNEQNLLQFGWKSEHTSPEIVGAGKIKKISNAFYAIMRIPLKDVLKFALGYYPEEYKNDNTWVCLPLNFANFRFYGDCTLYLTYSIRPNYISLRPKYCQTRYNLSPQNADGSGQWWNADFWKKFPFSFNQDNIRFHNVKNSPIELLYSDDKPILTTSESVESGRDFRIYSTGAEGAYNVVFEGDGTQNLITNGTGIVLSPSMVLSNWWEIIAKQLPLLCDYEKGIDTLYKVNYWKVDVNSNCIINWKEETKTTNEELNDFKLEFGGLSTYWWSDINNKNTKVNKLKVSDCWYSYKPSTVIGITSETKAPTIITFNDDEWDECVCRCKVDNNGHLQPISVNTNLYCSNYKQNNIAEVELTCTNYRFQNQIIVGSRHFRVDKVETSDFKIFKVTMIEYPVE